MAVEGHTRVARVALDAGEHLARELLARVALAQLGALGVVKLVELEMRNEMFLVSQRLMEWG